MSSTSRLRDEHLTCRTFGHAWQPTVVNVTVDGGRKAIEYLQHLVCDRCETMRVQILAPDGYIVGNRYDYPDGYLQRGDDGRYDRRDVRVEYLNRRAVTNTLRIV